jgi:hypothetical protein
VSAIADCSAGIPECGSERTTELRGRVEQPPDIDIDEQVGDGGDHSARNAG